MIAVAALAMAPAPVLAQSDTSSIDGYAESLPAAEGDAFPAAKPKAKKPAAKRPAPAPAPAPNAAPAPSSGSPDSGAAASPAPSGGAKPTREKLSAADRRRRREAEEAVRRDPERRKRRQSEELLDRVSKDPAVGAPSAVPARAATDDDESALAGFLSPGSPVLWLVVGMAAIAALAFRSRGRLRSPDTGA
jgi:hypothetical protein